MAAHDYFLKIDGIPGESQDAKHKDEIQVHGFSFSEFQNGSMHHGGGGGSGKVNMQDFHFTLNVNKASPRLWASCACGQHIKKVILTCRKAGKDQHDYLTITFTDVLISSYHLTDDKGKERGPHEAISLNFAKMEYQYKEQKADGTLGAPVRTAFDLKQCQLV